MFGSVKHIEKVNLLAHQSIEVSDDILREYGNNESIDFTVKLSSFDLANISTDDLPQLCWLISKLHQSGENTNQVSEVENILWTDLESRIINENFTDLLRVALLTNFFGTEIYNLERTNELCFLLDKHKFIEIIIASNNLDLSFDGITGLLMSLINIIEKHKKQIRIYDSVILIITKIIAIIKQNIIEISSESEMYSFFPEQVNIEEDIYDINNRLTWINGDLNCAIALKKAAKIIADDSLEIIANRICKYTTQRRIIANTGINNRSIKTGVMGLVLSYRFLYEYTQDAHYKSAYFFWVIALKEFQDSEERGFLNNTEGIALAADSLIKQDSTLSRILFYQLK